MKVIRTAISGVAIVEPEVFRDQRGYFFESYSARTMEDSLGITVPFVQDNQSCSAKGVIRGLHYQLHPDSQGKLVRCIKGEVFDVAVDIRRSSPTFGSWVGEMLTSENCKQMWIPVGFAHGFMAITDGAELAYKTTAYYSAESERSIAWNDPTIDITWPEVGSVPVLSEKDSEAPTLDIAEVFG